MRKYFTAESTAKAVLTDAEMENGVALIDFGGGCTSVSIYQGNVMRYYASIPFGGRNITQDIKSECQISEALAENIKLAFGACMPDKLQSLSDKIIHIKSNSAEPDKQLTVKYLSEIITARVEEIMMAILYKIEESGFADMLRSGIVITGGCSKTANLGNFIYDISGYKVRTGYPRKLFSCLDCDGIAEPTSATSVGLILNALSDQTVNCAIETEQVSRIITEVETEAGKEIEIEVGAGEPGTEDNPQGTIWADDQIETIEKPKKKRERKPGFLTVTFTKIKAAGEKMGEKVKDAAYGLYQDIAEDEPEDTNE
jgi:cell division protein FtsA